MLSSCIQDDFDTLPVYIPPSIDASQVMNIGDLLTSNNLLGNCDLVSPTLLSGATYEGKYIKGVVTSDDFAGNFYKSLVIQECDRSHIAKLRCHEPQCTISCWSRGLCEA